MNSKINPFNPTSVVSSSLFAGRTQYLLRIIRKLEAVKKGMPASFFLHGERGIGKTALAKLLIHVAESKNPKLGNLDFLVSYYSADKGQPIGSVLEASLNELTEKFSPKFVKFLSTKVGPLLKGGKFTIGAFGVDLTSQTKETLAIRDRVISILSNIITGLAEQNGERKKDGVLIVIDEMSNVSDIAICAQLFRGIATSLDVKSLGRLAFLLIGYDHTLANFYEGDASARRHFDQIPLGAMPAPEAKEVLTKGFKEVKVKWDEKALDINILVTGGYPHSIQMLGHNLIECDKDSIINADDWQEAITQTATELRRKDFAEMYGFGVKPSGREIILDILAVSGRAMSRKDIQKYTDIKNPYQYINELIKRGSVSEDPKTKQLVLHTHLFQTAIILEIIDRIRNEGYLRSVINDYVDTA